MVEELKVISDHFDLSDIQAEQFSQLFPLYRDWNQKINVISRKDIDNLAVHHVLHSLAIAKYCTFSSGSRILDIGTGGGYPGIPLAIMFPESEFVLVDGTSKKLKVVTHVAEILKLENVVVKHARAEEMPKSDKYDFVTARAVTTIDRLMSWAQPKVSDIQKNGLPNGLLALKGGDFNKERPLIPKSVYYDKQNLSKYFSQEFFNTKYLLYLQL